jgi:hypothetical protein
MLKRLAILAIAIIVVPVYAHQQAASEKQTQSSAKPGHQIVAPPAEQAASAERQHATQKDIKADVNVVALPRKDWEDLATFGINLALALAAFAGIGVGIWTLCYIRSQATEMRHQRILMRRTLNTIRKQTGTMERQIVLQETLNQQWLEIRGWRREGEGPRETEPPQFSVACEIVNPTNMPLTINVINIGVRTTRETFGAGNELPPGQSIKIAFPIIVASDTDLEAYRAHRFILTFCGSIEYTDAFKKKQEQPFSCTGVFGPKHFNRFSLVPIPRMV